MKKILVFSVMFVTIATSFTFITDTFVTGIGSQSVDVTVGEVDKIDIDEEQDIDAPQTGIFGLGAGEKSFATAVTFAIPVALFVIFLSGYFYRRG